MASKRCLQCGSDVVPVGGACPKCGTRIGLATSTRVALFAAGCCALAIVVALVCVIIAAVLSEGNRTTPDRQGLTSSGSDRKPASAQGDVRVYKMGESFLVGYTTYCASKAWWSTRLSRNQLIDHRPDGVFLNVLITVRNDDTKARMIPPFHLIDENGAEYDSDPRAGLIEGNIDALTDLNPGVTKLGRLVFDVLKGHTYKLKVSGGYWSGDDALIVLDPSEKP